MIRLSPKTIEVLTLLINEKTIYRSGRDLVELFNEVGFRDVYGGPGFPSRANFTSDHLSQINGRPELEKIIRMVFSPRQFSETPEKFAESVDALNAELKFDGWEIFWDECQSDISFRRVTPAKAFAGIVHTVVKRNAEDEFLKKEFADVDFNGLISIPGVQRIVEDRMSELNKCLKANAPLSAIFLTGSILEAVLLSVATMRSREFCAASSSPKDKQGITVQIPKWRLEALINVAKECGYLKEDVCQFCHVVRDFRNYIHPFEQNMRGFSPDLNTVKICLQVLKGAIAQIHERLKES